jgi:hypothetical protein
MNAHYPRGRRAATSTWPSAEPPRCAPCRRDPLATGEDEAATGVKPCAAAYRRHTGLPLHARPTADVQDTLGHQDPKTAARYARSEASGTVSTWIPSDACGRSWVPCPRGGSDRSSTQWPRMSRGAGWGLVSGPGRLWASNSWCPPRVPRGNELLSVIKEGHCRD